MKSHISKKISSISKRRQRRRGNSKRFPRTDKVKERYLHWKTVFSFIAKSCKLCPVTEKRELVTASSQCCG